MSPSRSSSAFFQKTTSVTPPGSGLVREGGREVLAETPEVALRERADQVPAHGDLANELEMRPRVRGREIREQVEGIVRAVLRKCVDAAASQHAVEVALDVAVFQTSSVRACARTCVVAWLSRTGRGRHPALSQAFVRRSDPCGNYSRSRTLTNTSSRTSPLHRVEFARVARALATAS
jgi:hypothetical protein